MKNSASRIGLIILMIVLGVQVFACRYTVREIGFSTLSRDIYTLVIIDADMKSDDSYWMNVRKRLNDSNINLLVLDTIADHQHPIIKKYKERADALPAKWLIAPDGRELDVSDYALEEALDFILDSQARMRMKEEFPHVFSVILMLEGKDQEDNRRVSTAIDQASEQIENIMPHMPKQVRQGPITVSLSADEQLCESVLLWSLGLDHLPDTAMVFVIYGRGRIMGDRLSEDDILSGRLYEHLAMIGADCECGLDRKWMLGRQIPLLWNAENRKRLLNEVGFDVDNPMILAEMTRILAKENNQEMDGELSFGPEEIDLNKTFFNTQEKEGTETDKEVNRHWPWWIAVVLLIGIIISGFEIARRNRKS